MPKYQLGRDNTRKIQPKLRMIANGDSKVNAARSEFASAVAMSPQSDLVDVPMVLTEQTVPLLREQVKGAAPRGTLDKPVGDVDVSIFIETMDASRALDIDGIDARKGNLAVATVPLSRLPEIARDENVTRIELGESLAAPTPEIGTSTVDPPLMSLRRVGEMSVHHGGEGVLIGIIDVQGFDFSHPDFLDDQGNTRFYSIWDQGGNARPNPSRQAPVGMDRSQFNFGAEFKQPHMNAAIAAASNGNLPAYELERQSQIAESSHGTHVASIAAGNRGVCRRSKIAAVLISLPENDYERRRSFYDSSRIVHAIDYLISVAEELGLPVSINISLGTNGHAHDSSAAVSRWIDSSLAVPGRAVCVAAGNAGQEVAAFEGDTGYVMGRIHTSGRIPSAGLNRDIEWLVVGNGIADLSENELEIWYNAQDRFRVSVRPPGGNWIGPVRPQEFIENRQLGDDTFISIYNELYNPANGNNYIAVYLSPYLSTDRPILGVRAGKWTIRLEGEDVRCGDYHGWIERDDPRRLGRIGDRDAWRFPSFFSQTSNVDNSSVSSLACGQRVISVANLDADAERISISSSQGPTRDGRQKPDVAAPGTNIVAANGFAASGNEWVAMSGTSMASPYVAGVIGLMLSVEPKLTAAQIEGIIQRTARPLPASEYAWSNAAGFGRIDPEGCLREARTINSRRDITE
jgi:subtilisin family serine protease